MTRIKSLLAKGSYAALLAALSMQPASGSSVIRKWEFDVNNDREGWSIPERMTGAVMGGSLWLTPTPKEKDPAKLTSLNYQIFGDYNVLKRILAGEKASETGPSSSGGLSIAGPSSVDIVSPGDLRIEALSQSDQQLQIKVRLLNLSPATNLDFKWRSKDMAKDSWSSKRCNLKADLKQWQEITCFFGRQWRGTVDQIALGVSENVIRGDLWIDSIRIESGPAEPIPVRPDVASAGIVPKVSIPGLSQTAFADAFKVLDEGLVVDVPAYGFPYPFMKASGDAKYGDYAWPPDTSLNAAAAAWVNQPFAENVIRGFHEVQSLNPDGRLSGYPWEAVSGQVGDVNQCPEYFFESAYAIAIRSPDPALRAEIYQTMHNYLDWYLSPIKRDQDTGLVTGTWEESVGFPPSSKDLDGLSYVRSRAPVSLNVGIAVAASLTADLAADLGKTEEADRYRRVFSELKTAINAFLWDENDGVYYDYNLKTKQMLRYRTAATFFPFRLAIAPESRQQRLIRRLTDPAEFNWGKTPVPNIAMTEDAPVFDGRNFNAIWALTNVPIIKGLEESGRSDLAAELNWSMLKLFHGNYSEVYSLSGKAEGGQRYGFTAAGYISGVMEHLFGIDYDAVHGQVRIAPHVPKALYGKDLALDDVILPTEGEAKLSVRINQSAAAAAKITVDITGKLPDGTIQVALPGSSKTSTVPTQHSLTVVFP
jgi:Trehalase